MKRILKKVFLFLNYIFIAALLLSYLSKHISPDKFWPFAFFGLAFPYLLVLNAFIVIFWISFRKKYFLISLIVIVLGWNDVSRYIQVKLKKEKNTGSGEIKILSYNVRLFNYFKWIKDDEATPKMISFIENENPDIICFQEFYVRVGKNEFSMSYFKRLLNHTPYHHVHYSHELGSTALLGSATFSKYPIIHKGAINFENSLNTCIYTDLKIGADTIRVFNTHLQSISLKKNNYNFLDSLLFNYDKKHLDEMKDISYRLRDAYILRAGQADVVSDFIKKSPYPVIVCGDFNDTPVSYAYHTISEGLEDSFVESGSGISNTYLGNFPSFRIDYILHSKFFNSVSYKRAKVKWSDHYPIFGKLKKR